MFNISKEMIIILVIVLVIFGPKQLPQLGKMFGKTMKDLRAGMDGAEDEKADPDAAPKKVAQAGSDAQAELEGLRAENARLAAIAKATGQGKAG